MYFHFTIFAFYVQEKPHEIILFKNKVYTISSLQKHRACGTFRLARCFSVFCIAVHVLIHVGVFLCVAIGFGRFTLHPRKQVCVPAFCSTII